LFIIEIKHYKKNEMNEFDDPCALE